MQSVLKTLNVMKWLPEEAETKPEKQLREDLVKKKKKPAVNTLLSSSIQGKAREFLFM